MFQAIEFIAVVTAATYGILEARAARMDPLGVITVAFAVAFGGGTLRDLFLRGVLDLPGRRHFGSRRIDHGNRRDRLHRAVSFRCDLLEYHPAGVARWR
ncbi:MAG: TRIC cation channel family protein [Planctomycetaceae bacterium]|nr:TRIC cation channel family protein [Planctomycetaceae bacterium]